MKDGVHYTVYNVDWKSGKMSIDEYSYKTGKKVRTLVDLTSLGIGRVSSEYQLSEDESKILIYTNKKPIYRRSFTADFYVYDIKTKKLTKVSKEGKERIASLSPDGTKLAYMRDNNLYIKDLQTGKLMQITKDGKKNNIINGAPDWVYEEEFSFNKAYEWSPDSKYLAFIRFDESKVKEYTLIKYAGEAPHYKQYELYPGLYTYKYPKAGENNSIVSVHIYNLATKKTVKADIGTNTDIYIPRIKWNISGDELGIERLNRAQNKIELLYANPNTGESRVVLADTNKYYIGDEVYDNIVFLPDGKHIMLMSERDGWRHLYLYDTKGDFVKQLTKGKWDITKYLGYNPEKEIFYFQAAKVSPIWREIYSVDMKGRIKKLSSKEGTNDAEFSTGCKYYINTYSNATTPYYITLNNAKGKVIRILEDNAGFMDKINSVGGIHKTFFKFKTSEGIELNAYRIVPPDFDSTKIYPAIIMQYSGPNSQTVLDDWEFGWNNYLADQGFVIFGVDPRGTGARGEKFRKVTFHELGKYETIDLVNSAKYFGSLPYIDKKRIGIWGWSYGGFMVLNAMTKGNGVFNTGVAVAPVTNWRFYDNIYTERYMGKPQDNPSGYDDNSPLNFVKDFKGNLLLCFGTADDNVHPQNSFEFIERMVQANKHFRVFPFVNRNHGIYGGNTRLYLYTMKTNFFEEHLMKKSNK
jgi:dipeptidyl-peptidase-4